MKKKMIINKIPYNNRLHISSSYSIEVVFRKYIFILVFWAGRPFSNFYNEFKILGLLYLTPDIQKIQRQTQTTTQATETTNFKYSGHSLGCAGYQEERKFACTQWRLGSQGPSGNQATSWELFPKPLWLLGYILSWLCRWHESPLPIRNTSPSSHPLSS